MAERSLKLEIRDMTKRYDNGDGVEHINLKIYEGEIVTMLGPSGCGKSTILRTIGGFLDVTDGDILIDNESIVKLPPEKRPTAMVFQSYNLWTHMTVYENLAFGLKLRKIPKDQIRADIDKHLKLVSMSGFEKKYPTQLSGGQQQRIAIARCFGRQNPPADARRVEEDSGRTGHHRGIRDPRSGRGHGPVPPHRGHEQGQI